MKKMNRLMENIDEDYFKKELENIKQDGSMIIEETYYHCIDCISEFMKQFTTLNNNLNLLNIPQNNGSILPEYILHAYLQATIEKDISTFNDSDDSITILNKDNLRTFVETFKIGGRDNFSKKIKLFRTSYKNYIYGNSKQPSLFQNRFYDFLTTYNIISIKNPSESLNYAVPLHFAPIFISIINAWTYSPVAYSTQSMNTVNKQLSFHS